MQRFHSRAITISFNMSLESRFTSQATQFFSALSFLKRSTKRIKERAIPRNTAVLEECRREQEQNKNFDYERQRREINRDGRMEPQRRGKLSRPGRDTEESHFYYSRIVGMGDNGR